MRFIGIDPGIVETAIVIVEQGGTVLRIKTFLGGSDKDEPRGSRLTPRRLRQITGPALEELRPSLSPMTVVAIEEPFVGPNWSTALKTHGVFAVLADVLQEAVDAGRLRRLLVVAPSTVKRFVGAKKKGTIAREVFKRWKFESDDHNFVDAYAIAMWARQECRD